jgi:HAD superfamily hydrolase (TIGR01493 family)
MIEPAKYSPIQAVFLDFGGVLYQTPAPRWLPFLLRIMRCIMRKKWKENGILLMMHTSAQKSPVVIDLMIGLTPEQTAWNELERTWRLPPTLFQYIRRRAFDPKRLNWELLDDISQFRPRLKTALLTNAGTDFRPTFVKEYDLDRYFDRIIISAEEGLAKPDPRLYHQATQYLGITPSQAVFFDDRDENVAAARDSGMQSYGYKNNEQVMEIINYLLNQQE